MLKMMMVILRAKLEEMSKVFFKWDKNFKR